MPKNCEPEYEHRYGFAKIEVKQGRVPLYRVLVGRESTEAAAERIANELTRIRYGCLSYD